MDEKTDYEKMAEEYAKVKPLALQAAPFLGEEGREREGAIRPLARLIGIYGKIEALLGALRTEVGPVRDIIISSIGAAGKIRKALTLLYSEACGSQPPDLRKTEPLGYTPAIRAALCAGAEGCASCLSYGENGFLKNKLPISEQQTLQLLLLTLTAF